MSAVAYLLLWHLLPLVDIKLSSNIINVSAILWLVFLHDFYLFAMYAWFLFIIQSPNLPAIASQLRLHQLINPILHYLQCGLYNDGQPLHQVSDRVHKVQQ